MLYYNWRLSMKTRTREDIEFDIKSMIKLREECLKDSKKAFDFLYRAGIICKNGKLRAIYR